MNYLGNRFPCENDYASRAFWLTHDFFVIIMLRNLSRFGLALRLGFDNSNEALQLKLLVQVTQSLQIKLKTGPMDSA